MLDESIATLDQQGFDHQKWIGDLGQVGAHERRRSGEAFTLTDHVRGLLLAQLINDRPWGPIAEKLDEICKVFFDSDPQSLKCADPNQLASEIRKIRCENRSIVKQMQGLRQDIETFERIGDVDNFVTSAEPALIAQDLAGGRHKLVQIGFSLAMEYLRNVGMNTETRSAHLSNDRPGAICALRPSSRVGAGLRRLDGLGQRFKIQRDIHRQFVMALCRARLRGHLYRKAEVRGVLSLVLQQVSVQVEHALRAVHTSLTKFRPRAIARSVCSMATQACVYSFL